MFGIFNINIKKVRKNQYFKRYERKKEMNLKLLKHLNQCNFLYASNDIYAQIHLIQFLAIQFDLEYTNKIKIGCLHWKFYNYCML